jgi:hypothetical protein
VAMGCLPCGVVEVCEVSQSQPFFRSGSKSSLAIEQSKPFHVKYVQMNIFFMSEETRMPDVSMTAF